MGEIADAMLDGALCQECGVWMGHREDEPPPGFPMTCGACQQDMAGEDERRTTPTSSEGEDG